MEFFYQSPINFKNIFISIISFLFISISDFFGAGTSSFQFLKITPEPYITSIGEGGIALEEANSKNPASYAFSFRNIVSVSYFPYLFGDFKFYNITGVYIPPFGGTIAGDVNYITYDIPYYSNSYAKLYLPASNEVAIGAYYATYIKKLIPTEKIYGSYGIGLKLINSNLAGYSSQALACDLGGIFKLSSILNEGNFLNNFSLGVSIKNLGTKSKYVKKTESIPTTYNLGISYNDLNRIIIVADAIFSNETEPIYSLGITLTPIYNITTSFGYKFTKNSALDRFNMGFTIEVKDFRIEYSLTNSPILNAIHKFSIKYFFSYTPLYISYRTFVIKKFIEAKENYYRGNYTTAQEILNDILEIYPDFEEASELKQKIQTSLSGLTTAKQQYVEKCIQKINKAIENNNLPEAKRYYNILLKIDKYNPLLPHIEDKLKKIEQDYKTKKIIYKKTKEIETLYNQAINYLNQQDYQKAKECFKEILQISPQHEKAKEYLLKIESIESQKLSEEIQKELNIAVELYNKNRFQEALAIFQKLKTKAPNRTDIDKYIKKCNEEIEKQKQIEEMQKKQTEQIETKPKQQELAKKQQQLIMKFEEAKKLFENNNFEKALAMFETIEKEAVINKLPELKQQSYSYIIKTKKSLAEENLKKAIELKEKEKFEDAFEAYKKSLNYSYSETVKNELEKLAVELADKYYKEGIKYFLQGEKEKAKEMFIKSLYYQDREETKRALERVK